MVVVVIDGVRPEPDVSSLALLPEEALDVVLAFPGEEAASGRSSREWMSTLAVVLASLPAHEDGFACSTMEDSVTRQRRDDVDVYKTRARVNDIVNVRCDRRGRME